MLFESGDNIGRAVPIQYDAFVRERNGYRPTPREGLAAIRDGSEQISKAKHLGLSDLQRLVYEGSERFTIYAMREF